MHRGTARLARLRTSARRRLHRRADALLFAARLDGLGYGARVLDGGPTEDPAEGLAEDPRQDWGWVPGMDDDLLLVGTVRPVERFARSRHPSPEDEPASLVLPVADDPLPLPAPAPVPAPAPIAMRERFPHLRAVRWEPSRHTVFAAALAVVIVVAAVVLWFLNSRPATTPVPALSTPITSSASYATAQNPAPSPGVVVVDVVGYVARPGVYTLSQGARVADAIAAAGGVAGEVDTTTVNMARVVSDGEQIAIGVPGAPAGPVTGAGGAVVGSGLINLNTATADQLDALPGVGPVLAGNILSWRASHGRFTSVDQLRDVSGIGDTKFAEIRPRVTI